MELEPVALLTGIQTGVPPPGGLRLEGLVSVGRAKRQGQEDAGKEDHIYNGEPGDRAAAKEGGRAIPRISKPTK